MNGAAGSFAIEWRRSDAPVPYEEAVAVMERRATAIREGSAPELVWLLEHPALYTAGTSAHDADLIEPNRLPVFKSGRGGQYTYHGAGQRVAYAMLDLDRPDLGPSRRDVRCHVWRLEEWMIRTLALFGVRGERRDGRIGVWVTGPEGEAKIAAIGVRVRRWVTYHGVALNVDPDLANYAGIIPCGLAGYGVTSLAALGVAATTAEADGALRATFDGVFAAGLACVR